VGVQLPQRGSKPLTRVALVVAVGLVPLLLGACSAEDQEQIRNLAMPATDATDRSPLVFELWQWSWLAAILTGILVWGLIFWVIVRYRRRNDEVPVQTRYNLPLEIFYTFVPIVMVVVFFAHTVQTQNEILEPVEEPDHVIDVVGQQWSWTFNYTDEDVAAGRNVYESGTGSYIPTLVLPVDESVTFRLHSPDVIHSFWVTGFLFKMDVVPGRVNEFSLTPTETGEYAGKCAELCGAYHSRMLFNVEVVSAEEYDAYLLEQIDRGFVSDEPLLGQDYSRDQVGLESGDEQDGGQE
jgi:cytochrome c oxidase subunit 2